MGCLQVMKMVMTLVVQESGHIHYVKRPGAVLESGCVVSRIDLDDPSKVLQVSNKCCVKIYVQLYVWMCRVVTFNPYNILS